MSNILRLHELDNVGICKVALPAGTQLITSELRLANDIPARHRSGAQIICFTTGRGSAFGCKPAPCVKLLSNTSLYERMKEDIDINCGGVLDGEISVSQCGENIFQEILKIASGKAIKSELLGYGDNEFNPWKIGATV